MKTSKETTKGIDWDVITRGIKGRRLARLKKEYNLKGTRDKMKKCMWYFFKLQGAGPINSALRKALTTEC